MPGFDRSGPMGNGPMTGGSRGLCGSAVRRQMTADGDRGLFRSGLGCRRGFGGGRGWRSGPGADMPAEQVSAGQQQDSRREVLEAQVRELQRSLEKLQKGLDDL